MKTVFLDRDGVINPLLEREGRKVSPQSVEDFEFLPGAREAIEEANRQGFRVVVLTNQPDVGKAWRELDEEELEKMNQELLEAGVDSVYACTHGPKGDSEEERYYREEDEIVVCDCRKPQPGLLERAAEDLDIDFPSSYVIGDSKKDIKAAERFEEGHGVRFAGKFAVGELGNADRSFDNLKETISHVVSRSS